MHWVYIKCSTVLSSLRSPLLTMLKEKFPLWGASPLVKDQPQSLEGHHIAMQTALCTIMHMQYLLTQTPVYTMKLVLLKFSSRCQWLLWSTFYKGCRLCTCKNVVCLGNLFPLFLCREPGE